MVKTNLSHGCSGRRRKDNGFSLFNRMQFLNWPASMTEGEDHPNASVLMTTGQVLRQEEMEAVGADRITSRADP